MRHILRKRDDRGRAAPGRTRARSAHRRQGTGRGRDAWLAVTAANEAQGRLSPASSCTAPWRKGECSLGIPEESLLFLRKAANDEVALGKLAVDPDVSDEDVGLHVRRAAEKLPQAVRLASPAAGSRR